jgi:hypothetical protein
MAALVPISECQQLSIPLALFAGSRSRLAAKGSDNACAAFLSRGARWEIVRIPLRRRASAHAPTTHSMPGPCRSASQLAPQHHSGGRALAGEGGIRVNSWVSGGFLPRQVRGTKYEGLACAWDWCEFGPPALIICVAVHRPCHSGSDFCDISQMCLAKRPSVSRRAAHTAPRTTDGTFSELAGIDPTDHRAAAAGLPPIDSHSLVPVLMGTGPSSRKEVRQCDH